MRGSSELARLSSFSRTRWICARGGGEMPDHAAQIVQDGRPARLHDGMNRIEPQAVETIAVEPMQRISDRECAHLRNAIIDGVAPRRMRGSEERRRIAVQEVSFRAEMIVDDVEKHHEAARMRSSISARRSSGRP